MGSHSRRLWFRWARFRRSPKLSYFHLSQTGRRFAVRCKWTLRHRFVKALPSGFERPEFGAGAQEVFLPVGAMHRAISVSACRAAPAGPTHSREKPASRRGREKSRETWTLRWRGLCAKIGLFRSSRSVFGQASISAGEPNHALSRKRRC